MIELSNVDFTYGKNGTKALNDITTAFAPGVHLLLGENGAGKTTLLRTIAGLLKPKAGTCTIDGVETWRRLPSILAQTALVESGQTVPQRDLGHLVKYHACFYPTFDAGILDSCLGTFGIGYKQPFSSMSLGQRQKALLSYTISLQTQYILLDEPTNGLDIDSKTELQRMLVANIPEDATVIVSTHTVTDLFAIYDAVTIMHHNRIICKAKNDTILETFSFVSGPGIHPMALYSEPVAGRIISLIPADCGIESTAVDYRILFRALNSPRGTEIANMLNNKN